jgi:hypothetical protein
MAHHRLFLRRLSHSAESPHDGNYSLPRDNKLAGFSTFKRACSSYSGPLQAMGNRRELKADPLRRLPRSSVVLLRSKGRSHLDFHVLEDDKRTSFFQTAAASVDIKG